MRAITYALVAGVFFWTGSIHEAARAPMQPFKVVRPDTAPLTPALTPICENLTEIRRACVASKRSELIQQINPNTKGKL